MLTIDLNGHQALVCGASQGIGKEIAKTFAQAGAKVVALARREEKLKDLMHELHGEGHSFLSADLKETNQVREKVVHQIAQRGPIDILVGNSAGPAGGPLLEAGNQAFVDGLQAHILTQAELVRCLLPGMQQKGFGRIIHIISTSVKSPIPNLGASNTIRGAVASWSKTLANELGPQGITVNNILPGFTQTERLDTLIDAASSRLKLERNKLIEQWQQTVPLKRFANPQETANLAAFLASDLASYITGVSIPVDGGRLTCL